MEESLENLKENLAHLESKHKEFLSLANEICSARDSALFAMDLFILSALKKALSINSGFITLVKSDNYISSCALLRLQLDTALRLFASTLVKNGDKFVMDFIDGIEIRKLKDSKNKFMTDAYLHTELSRIHPWLSNVYKQSSGFVHLSEKHFYSTFSKDKNRKMQFVLSDKDESIDIKNKIETVLAMLAANGLIFDICIDWLRHKSTRSPSPS